MTPLAGSPKEVATLLAQQQTMRLAERKETREAALDKDKGAYYKSEAAKNFATIAGLEATAEGRKAAKTFLDAYEKLSPEQQQGPEGYRLLSRAAVAQAAKSGDASAAAKATDYGRALDAHSKAVEQAAKDGVTPPTLTQSLAGFGFAPPEVIKMVETGKRPDGTPLKPAEIDTIKSRYPNSFGKSTSDRAPAAPAAAPAAAIPTASAPSRPSPAQTVAAQGSQKYPAPAIPVPPPPKYIGGRGGQRLNPAYVEWEAQQKTK
jgi:hypothetical protein